MKGRASHKIRPVEEDKSTLFRGNTLLEQLKCLKKCSLRLSLKPQCRENVQPQGMSDDFAESAEIIFLSVHGSVNSSPYT